MMGKTFEKEFFLICCFLFFAVTFILYNDVIIFISTFFRIIVFLAIFELVYIFWEHNHSRTTAELWSILIVDYFKQPLLDTLFWKCVEQVFFIQQLTKNETCI